MVKVGQEVGRCRDGAGRSEVAPEVVVSVPWAPVDRGDARAILVSERSARFDRRMPSLPPLSEAPVVGLGALGPMPMEWTWDLVHCRLLSVYAIACRLPRVSLPANVRSILGLMQPQDAAPGPRRVLTDDDTRRLDWTLTRLAAWSEIDRAVLMGIMSGKSVREVSKSTIAIAARFGSKGLQKSAVHDRYRRNTTIMAAEWNGAGEPIDEVTRECWLIAST
jgi:hypothetical protein